MQHQCALILGLMANYLGFVGALYCTCKQLRSGEHLARLEKCIRHIIDSELVFDQRSYPQQQDLDRVKAIMAVTYRRPVELVRDSTDDDDEVEQGKRD
jgi:hypothetical protein